MGSDQVATVLRQSGAQVRLVVARPTNERASSQQRLENPAIIQTAMLDEYLVTLNAQLDGAGAAEVRLIHLRAL